MVPPLPLWLGITGYPRLSLSFSKDENEEVLRWGREGEGADSFLPLMTLRQSTRWPLWVPALHTAGLRMVTLVVLC